MTEKHNTFLPGHLQILYVGYMKEMILNIACPKNYKAKANIMQARYS